MVMTHRKYLTVLLQKQTNKTLLMELQSTDPRLWNQPKLEEDPCYVTKESNDLEKVLQPLWASVSSDKWGDFCPLCLLAADNTTLWIHSKNKGWQSSSGTRTHSPHRQGWDRLGSKVLQLVHGWPGPETQASELPGQTDRAAVPLSSVDHRAHQQLAWKAAPHRNSLRLTFCLLRPVPWPHASPAAQMPLYLNFQHTHTLTVTHLCTPSLTQVIRIHRTGPVSSQHPGKFWNPPAMTTL